MLMHLKRKNKKKFEDVNHNTLITLIIVSNYKEFMDRIQFISMFFFQIF